MEETKCLKPSDNGHDFGDHASVQAATRVNAEQSSHDEGLVKGSHHGDIETSSVASVQGPSPFARREDPVGPRLDVQAVDFARVAYAAQRVTPEGFQTTAVANCFSEIRGNQNPAAEGLAQSFDPRNFVDRRSR
jgi:hypothetical protein